MDEQLVRIPKFYHRHNLHLRLLRWLIMRYLNIQMKDKNINANYFSKDVIRSWDDSDGVNYAVAFSRLTGWLLHVDWLRYSDKEENENNMKSLRVYVGDSGNNIYDAQGRRRVAPFVNSIIKPLMKKRGGAKVGLLNRYYTEERLFELPLRIKPDSTRIESAIKLMKNNVDFFTRLPVRQSPCIPAKKAADFTFGHCVPFTAALKDLTGLKATSIIASRFINLFGYTPLGYVHSFLLHPDGKVEDAWGVQTIGEIAARFGIEEYKLSEAEHEKAMYRLKLNSPEKYEAYYLLATDLIKKYRLQD